MANLKQIERYLKSLKLPYKVVDLGGEVFTVKGVVETGVNEEEVVKTLIVRIGNAPYYSSSEAQRSREVADEGNSRQARIVNLVALAIRGKDRVDFKKVRRLFGSKSELAKWDEVLKICSVPVGAVCPILLDVPLIFDRRVMNLNHVNMGSSDLTKGLEMDFDDLLCAVGKYQVEDLV